MWISSYSLILSSTIFILYQIDRKQNIKMIPFIILLAVILIARVPPATTFNSVWAEDGLFFSEAKINGLAALKASYNGYYQFGFRVIFAFVSQFSYELLPFLIFGICTIFYGVMIYILLSLDWNRTNSLVNRKHIVIGFVSLPLLSYETIGNINNLGILGLVVTTCYLVLGLDREYKSKTVKSKLRFVIILPILLSTFVASVSPGAFPIILLALVFSIYSSFSNISRFEWILLIPSTVLSCVNFTSSLSTRVSFQWSSLENFGLDFAYRLLLAPVLGAFTPDLRKEAGVSIWGCLLVLATLAFMKIVFGLFVYAKKNEMNCPSARNFDSIILIFCLFLPSAMAIFAAGPYILSNDLTLRWGLMGAGKFISASFAVFMSIYVSVLIFFKSSSKTKKILPKKRKSRSQLRNTIPLKSKSQRVFHGALILVVAIFYSLNLTSNAGRLPADYSERLKNARSECSIDSTYTETKVEISPHDGNWNIRVNCSSLIKPR